MLQIARTLPTGSIATIHFIMTGVRRITLFKIPREEDQQKLLELYKGMRAKATKVSHYKIMGVPALTPVRNM
jgi:hypothetical protein